MPKVKKKASSILDRAKPVSELPKVIAGLFYGRSGTGKTTISSTFPKPLLLLDIGERGTDSINDIKGVDVIQIEDWDDIEEIFWELEGSKYKTVVIDSAHSLQALAITNAKTSSGKDEDAQTSQRDYGIASGKMQTWIYNYRDLVDHGINVLFLAHERVNSGEDSDDEDGMLAPEVGPRLMPSVASCLTGSVHVVGNTYVKETITRGKKLGEKSTKKVEYSMRLGPHGYYTTKLRSPKKNIVPEFIIDPTYDKIVDTINGVDITPKPQPKTGTPKKRTTTKKAK